MNIKNDAHVPRHRPVSRSSSGFGLVEVMVALVIGTLAILVVLQVFALSEGSKRTTTGGSDAQSTAALALYQLQRDVRQAGYGISPNVEDFGDPPTTLPAQGGTLKYGILAFCGVVRSTNTVRAPTDFIYDNSTFAPFLINPKTAAGALMFPAGDDNSDVIMVNYSGSTGMVGNGVNITENAGTVQTNGTIPDYVATTSRAGFHQGDLFLAAPPVGSGLDCSIGEITGLPLTQTSPATLTSECAPTNTITDPGQPNLINHNLVNYKTFYGCPATAKAPTRNKDFGIVYNAGSKLYNLGPVGSFVSRVYAVRGCGAATGCMLAVCDYMASNCTDATKVTDQTVWVPVASGIVSLKAQYGRDTTSPPDGLIDNWSNTTPTAGITTGAGTGWQGIIAVRLALVARSNQYEKPDATGAHVTTAAPIWRADAPTTADANIDVSGGFPTATAWQDYRYKVVQSIEPLRNMVWGQQLP